MADLHIKPSGSWKAIDNAYVKVSSAWKQVEKVYIKVAGVWQQVWIFFTVSASDVSGSDTGFSACGAVSTSGDSPNTTPSGGTAPYTYAWTKMSSASGNAFSISSATTQNPVWSATRCDTDLDNTEGWRVTVTDANGATASADITVALNWTDIT